MASGGSLLRMGSRNKNHFNLPRTVASHVATERFVGHFDMQNDTHLT